VTHSYDVMTQLEIVSYDDFSENHYQGFTTSSCNGPLPAGDRDEFGTYCNSAPSTYGSDVSSLHSDLEGMERDIRYTNITANVSLGIPVDLFECARVFANCEMDANEKALNIQISRPRCRVTIYQSGKIRSQGTTSTSDAKIVLKKISRRIKVKIESRVLFQNFAINGIFASYHYPANLELVSLSRMLQERYERCRFEPEISPGIVLKNFSDTGCSLTIHRSGKIVLWAPQQQMIVDALRQVIVELRVHP